MDLSIIEGLTDEELNELYENNVIQDFENKFISRCVCVTPQGYINFGNAAIDGYCGPNHGYCGYCAMGSLVAGTDRCIAWCSRHGFYWSSQWSDEVCICTDGAEVYAASWYTCSR